jgi:hypothetical protein
MEREPARRERVANTQLATAAADTAPPPAQLVEGKAQQVVPPYRLGEPWWEERRGVNL